jgi:NitT/TauT family transport system substrate-binding protein
MTGRLTRYRHAVVAAVTLIAAVIAPGAEAQTKTVRLAKQFGISYLPLTIIEEKRLLEEHSKHLGLDLKTEWLQFTGGTPMNEALVSDNLDFASGGVGPLLTAWARTQRNLGIKGVSALKPCRSTSTPSIPP